MHIQAPPSQKWWKEVCPVLFEEQRHHPYDLHEVLSVELLHRVLKADSREPMDMELLSSHHHFDLFSGTERKGILVVRRRHGSAPSNME